MGFIYSFSYIVPVSLVVVAAWLFSKYTEDKQKRFLWLSIGAFAVSLGLAFWLIPALAVKSMS